MGQENIENSDALYSLGLCYENGYGIANNTTNALIWYKKAALQGNCKAQYNLGKCYYSVGILSEAKKWLSGAALKNSESAKQMLNEICCK